MCSVVAVASTSSRCNSELGGRYTLYMCNCVVASVIFLPCISTPSPQSGRGWIGLLGIMG